MIEAQGGDPNVTEPGFCFPPAAATLDVGSGSAGYLRGLRARPVGEWITEAGGGRLVAGAKLNHSVGVELLTPVGSKVSAGDAVLRLHLPSKSDSEPELLSRAAAWIDISDEPVPAFAPEIDRFLRRRFEPVKRYGRFWILVRRSADADA